MSIDVDRIGQIIVEGTDIRLTMLTRLIQANARRDQAIADLQTSIMRHMRILVDNGIADEITESLASMITVNADSYEAVGDLVTSINENMRLISQELYPVEAA